MATPRLCAIAALSVFAASAFAQDQFVDPNLMEAQDGTYMGIAWNLRGVRRLDPIKLEINPLEDRMLFSLYGNNPILQILKKNIGGSVNAEWITNTCAIRHTRAATSLTLGPLTPTEIVFPACDADSKDAAGIVVVASGDAKTMPPPDDAKLKAATQIAKRQKMWLCSAFRVRVGDLPCTRVNKIEAISVKQALADLDSDGAPDRFFTPGDLDFTVPMADAKPFQDAFNAAVAGKPTVYPVQLDYLDDSGNPIFSLYWTVTICAAGPDDLFNPFDPNGFLRVVGKKSKTFENIKMSDIAT